MSSPPPCRSQRAPPRGQDWNSATGAIGAVKTLTGAEGAAINLTELVSVTLPADQMERSCRY